MNHRVPLLVALSTSLFACDAGVTNLGSAREVTAPLVDTTTGSDDGGVDAGCFATDPADAETQQVQWRVYRPIADAEQENVYLLPEDADSKDAPTLMPANWDLAWARIEMAAEDGRRIIGYYKANESSCGDEHGWYFADGEQATATRYSLCPKSRARVTRPDDFELAVRWEMSQPPSRIATSP